MNVPIGGGKQVGLDAGAVRGVVVRDQNISLRHGNPDSS